jgi:hypothetical protein
MRIRIDQDPNRILPEILQKSLAQGSGALAYAQNPSNIMKRISSNAFQYTNSVRNLNI